MKGMRAGIRNGVAQALVWGIVGITPALTRADNRAFTHVNETTTMPKGAFEYEQWVTWKTDKDNDSSFDKIQFRHEIEFGITDRWQGAIYVADWSYQAGRGVGDDGTSFDDAAFETIYQLTDPTNDLLGTALYGEVAFGDEVLKLEGKLLLQKNLGPWIIAYNAIIEAQWEGEDYTEDKGVLGNTLGVSYQLSPSWAVGAELVHEVEYADWSAWGDHTVYVGPNASYRTQRWWVTVTPLLQLTGVADEPNLQTRLIFGVNF